MEKLCNFLLADPIVNSAKIENDYIICSITTSYISSKELFISDTELKDFERNLKKVIKAENLLDSNTKIERVDYNLSEEFIFKIKKVNDELAKLVIAWDLDGTLIDSSHRLRYKENNELDLDYWTENSLNMDIVRKDSLLPLVSLFQAYKNAGFTQICVTARDMRENDYRYLSENGLIFDMILHRNDSKDLDNLLKSKKIKDFLTEENRLPFMAFDDKEDNLEVFDSFGFRTFQAIYMNKKLERKSYSELSDISPSAV